MLGSNDVKVENTTDGVVIAIIDPIEGTVIATNLTGPSEDSQEITEDNSQASSPEPCYSPTLIQVRLPFNKALLSIKFLYFCSFIF